MKITTDAQAKAAGGQMNLATMTRDELWSLCEYQVIDLALTHRLRVYRMGVHVDKESLLEDLEELRFELQQSAADARKDSLEDR